MTALGELTHIELMVTLSAPKWPRCSEPERPGDNWAIYVWECRWCMLGLIMDVTHDPLGFSATREQSGELLKSSVMVDTLADAMAWRYAMGLSMEEPSWEPS